jgi:hypothetical protein
MKCSPDYRMQADISVNAITENAITENAIERGQWYACRSLSRRRIAVAK